MSKITLKVNYAQMKMLSWNPISNLIKSTLEDKGADKKEFQDYIVTIEVEEPVQL